MELALINIYNTMYFKFTLSLHQGRKSRGATSGENSLEKREKSYWYDNDILQFNTLVRCILIWNIEIFTYIYS